MTQDASSTRNGLLFGFGAYLAWGFLPIYFKALATALPTEVVAHRIVWSLLFLAIVLTALRRWPELRLALRTPRVLAMLALTALLIGVNWLIFIWAVTNGHVLEASLGYYLNPLVNILLGTMLLKEKLSRAQLAAVVLAGAGVAVLALGAGTGLWISLALAFSFALYGYVRKIAPVESLEGLSIETVILLPIALGWLLWLGVEDRGALGSDPTISMLLILSGPLTAIPLLLFAAAARRLPYSTLGFLQYVAPTLQFLSAVLLFGERLTTAHLICFGAIWTALAIFAGEGIRLGREASRARAAQADACKAAAECT